MPVERYALGTEHSSDSYCYAMEFGTPHLGSISGGSSRKLLIFKRRDTGEWWFDRRFSTLDEAWTATRAAFVRALDLAAAGNLLEIGDLEPINWAPALTTKTIQTYFPDQLLWINSHAHLEHFWALLKGEGDIAWGVPGAYQLTQLVRGRPEFEGWSTAEIGRFLYFWSHPGKTARIVKIAPGHDAALWEDCRANGYIRVGWEETGDLRDFPSKEEFRARFAEVFGTAYKGNQAKLTEKANEVWTLSELEPGDLVVANKGTSEVLAIGTVVEPGYERREDLPNYGHTVRVQWDESQARLIDPIKRWAFKTVAPIGQAEYQRILAGRTVATNRQGKQQTQQPVVPPDPIFGTIDGALRRKGQAILYGPPGTGKTYHARRFSVWWLAQRAGLDTDYLLGDPVAFARAERTLSTAQAERRVWWVVANPKEWSWDQIFKNGFVDYRYGRLQRNYALLQPGDLVIGYQANPDKRIVALAKVREGLHTIGDSLWITLEPIAPVANGPSYDELVKSSRARQERAAQVPQPGNAVRAHRRGGRLLAFVACRPRLNGRVSAGCPDRDDRPAHPRDLPPVLHLRGLRRGLQARLERHRPAGPPA